MSTLTKCNYCINIAIRKQDKLQGLKVTVLKTNLCDGVDGIDIFVHPKDIKIDPPKDIKIDPTDAKMRGLYFRAWFMALGRHCEC